MENFIDKIPMALLWYVVFLFSTTLHEAAHAFAALKLGDPTAYEGGQVTLDPLPHIRREPFGTIIVPIISFFVAGWMIGWASTPYSIHWAFKYPKRSALMALAGPLVHLGLIILTGFIIRLGILFDFFEIPETISFTQIATPNGEGFIETVVTFLSIFFILNLVLFIFNLLPVPPLDGSAVIMLSMRENLARKYMDYISNPALNIAGLLIGWRLFSYVFDPLHLLAINILYFGHNYH